MGWSGGSDLMETIIRVIQENVTDIETRKIMYRDIIYAMEYDHDCDCLEECVGVDPAYDAALRESSIEDDDI